MKYFRWMLIACIGLWQLAGVACRKDEGEFLRELSDPSSAKRAGAVRVLWRRGGEEAYRLADRALEDDSQAVRLAAVRALADFKDVDTLAALVRASRHQDAEVRKLAAKKLSERKEEGAREALLDLLALKENDAGNRRRLADLLRAKGMSEETLWSDVATRQVREAREDWASVPSPRRVTLARLAGRSVDQDGLQVVQLALDDPDLTVVGAALGVLENRGDLATTRKLYRLLTRSPVPVQMRILQELAGRGKEGEELVRGGIYSPHERVRLAALRLSLGAGSPPPAGLVCDTVRHSDPALAVEVVEAIARAGVRCPLEEMVALLAVAPPDSKPQAARLALALAGSAGMEKLLLRGGEAERLELGLARLQSGAADAAAASVVRRHIEGLAGEMERYCRRWVAGRIPPLPKEKEEDTQRLDDESLRQLYQKNQLPAPSPDSPRGVADLLAGFSDRREASFYQKLFDPLGAKKRGELLRCAAAYLKAEPAGGAKMLARILRAPLPRLAAAGARLAQEAGLAVQLGPEIEENLILHLTDSAADEAEDIARLLLSRGTDRARQAVLDEIKRTGWEKRQRLLATLAGNTHPQVLALLQSYLEGDSAAAAAAALAASGAREAVPAMRQALQKAAPGVEIELLEALSKLGDDGIVDRLDLMLYEQDPDLRLKAVDILANLSAETAVSALRRATWDPDRLVRKEARDRSLASGSGGQ